MKVVAEPLEVLEPLPVEPREPLPVDEPAGDDPGEALIKEAKQRARRRRMLYGAVAVVVAIAAVAAITLPGSPSSPHGDARAVPRPRTPLGAPPVVDPDASSTLLTSYGRFHFGFVLVYTDGRVIWHPDVGIYLDDAGRPVGYSTAWNSDTSELRHEYRDVERRLNQRGLELVRAGRIVPTDLLSSIISLSKEELDAYKINSRAPIGTSELWAEPTPTVYEPAHYAVCFIDTSESSPAAPQVPFDLTQGVAQLPAPAQALLHSTEQHIYDPSAPWSGLPQPPHACFKVTSAERTSLLQTFNDEDRPGSTNPMYEFVNLGMPDHYMTVAAIYPHGQYVPSGFG